MGATARAWVINGYDGYQGLRLVKVPIEQPGPGEVRLRIEAFALNWGDMDLMVDNYSFSFHHFPACVGIEAAGIVEAVGDGVEGITIGSRYCTLPYFYYNRGASTETLIVDARYITRAPPGLSAPESASIWMQYLTAYYPLAEVSKVGPESFVLATAATSTAGSAALEIGRMLGATMIGTTRFPSNVPYLKERGASHVIVTDSDGTSIAEQLLAVTGGKGIDVAFDPIGEGLISKYSPAFARDAHVYFYGTLDTKPPELPLRDMFQKNVTFQPYSVFNYVEHQEMRQRGVDYVNKNLTLKNISPNIDRLFPMNGYIEAWKYMKSTRSSHGKIVIDVTN